MITEKRCFNCKENYPIDFFHKGADRCKQCAKEYAAAYREANRDKTRASSKKSYLKNREKHLLRVEERRLEREYGLTKKAHNILFEQHNNRCAICNIESGIGLKKLVVDHCHSTGKVRGLLCRLCNTSLGGFKDNVDTLNAAIKYLEDRNG